MNGLMQAGWQISVGPWRRIVYGAAILLWHALASPAWAQRPGSLPNEDASLLPWVIAVGAVVVMALPAFRNPKRSHLS